MDPIVFVEMKPAEGSAYDPYNVFWRAIAEDGTRLDGTGNSPGWAVSSSPDWARLDSGLTQREHLVKWTPQRIREHYPNGFRMVEVSPDSPVPDELRKLFEAALVTYGLCKENP